MPSPNETTVATTVTQVAVAGVIANSSALPAATTSSAPG